MSNTYVFDIETRFQVNRNYSINLSLGFIKKQPIVGVYKITCTSNGKVYVGSSKNVVQRLSIHRRVLRANLHSSKSMQEDYDLYGRNFFEFTILEICEDLIDREQYYCDLFSANNFDFGYNKRKLVDSNKGNVIYVTDESRRINSESKKGKTPKNYKTMRLKVLKPVYMFVDNRMIQCFESQREASRQTGICYKQINYSTKRECPVPKNETVSFRYKN